MRSGPFRKTARLLLPAAACAAAFLLLSACSVSAPPGRELRGTVTDAASGTPVRGARIEFGGRTTTLYTTPAFRLTRLHDARGLLTVEADGYEPWQKEIELKGRETVFDISLTGQRVPDLAGILVWCAWEKDALRVDVRLTDSAGVTLSRFPVLPFAGEARLAVNVGTESRPRPGALLFDGPVSVSYDSASDLDRLRGRIPKESIRRPPPGASLGVLTFTLKAPQGSYAWTRGDVPLAGRGAEQ